MCHLESTPSEKLLLSRYGSVRDALSKAKMQTAAMVAGRMELRSISKSRLNNT
jgi:hypothetical protein